MTDYAASAVPTKDSPHHHAVQFYESAEYLTAIIADYLAPGFQNGNSMVLIARAETRKAVLQRLRDSGFEVDALSTTGQLQELDAHETLQAFMDSDQPHAVRFKRAIGDVFDRCQTRSEDLPILAYGEMVDVLWSEGRREAAIRLEGLWNELAKSYSFELLCAYCLKGFGGNDHLQQVCSAHTRAEVEHRKEADKALLRALDEQRTLLAELKRAQKAQWFLGAIVEYADDAIISKTLGGIITSWNPGAERLFGYKANEVIGKSVTLLIPERHRDEEPAILEKLGRGERIDHYETKRLRKDGTIIDISLTVSPVRDQNGKIIGASKIARDITERKRFETERAQLLEKEQEARREAEATSRIKDEFLAVVSHELRTPLNAVLGWTAILERQREEDTVIRAVEVIKRNAEMQKRMIEDLLDIARVLAGKMTIKTEPVNLFAVSEAALQSVAPAASAKEIRIEKHFHESLPSITGDADRLQQVAWNLLSNSIKFTPQNGTVRLAINCAGSHIELSVSDTGQGIRPEFLPHVFERFAQADSSLSRRHAGLGIGLAIVRYLVEAHGGRVWADSPGEGLGATFTVQLPVSFLKRS